MSAGTPQPLSIAKFASLTNPAVAEHVQTDVTTWLTHLTTRPDASYAGQFEHGGWSPVVYDPPRRAGANIRSVSMLVLDHDRGGDWDRLVTLWTDTLGAIYTTKSHTAAAPRLRVVLPLSRTVTAEEYPRLWDWASRRSAEAGCPVDVQCKDPSRFWYDVSAIPDWRGELLAGQPIDVDAVLALVEPPKLRVAPAPSPAPDAAQRLRRATAYLAKLPPAVSGNAGHTATFNACASVLVGFDLDPATAEQLILADYNPRCVPPWSEREIAHKITNVAVACKRERGYLLVDRPRIDPTAPAATYAPAAPGELDLDWTSRLICKKDRSIRRAYANVAVFVRHHPDYRGKWSVDRMTDTPWFDGQRMPASMVHEIRAAADYRLGFTPAAHDVEAAIVAAAADRPFHPILQYLRSIDWDGIPRIGAMARDYLGSDAAHHSEMLRKFMIGAAARVLRPGCKLDTALMLVGPQGYRKSTFFSTLGGAWHGDTFVDLSNKDGMMQVHSSWIYELAELENVVMGRAESRLKAWMSSSYDMFRAPYQRTVERRPRSFVLCGTTNRSQFLTDDTGSRRFWIVPVTSPIPHELLAQCRDQLWAEAVCAVEAGESWWLDGEADDARAAANVDFAEDDSWTDRISEWLASPIVTETTITEVLEQAIKLDVAKQDRWAQMRAAKALARCGWQRVKRGARSARQWRYIRGE